jgi:hypothetical protein
MFKKFTLHFLLTLFLTGSFGFVQAQEEDSYAMWESFYITPDNTKLKALGEAMANHNKKYHSGEGPYRAMVYNVMTGPNTGKMIWQMGPLNYSHLDGRPTADGHDEDWRDNVMPNVKKLSTGEFWKQNNKVSNTDMLSEEGNEFKILHVRYHEVARGEGHQVQHLMGQIGETVKAMEGNNPWGVYVNEFRQGYAIGRHIASVGFFKNWAEYDEEDTFKETFLKVHGENSWGNFVDGMNDTFSDSWDEVWQVNTALSGVN